MVFNSYGMILNDTALNSAIQISYDLEKVNFNSLAGSVGWSTFSLRVFSKPESLIEPISVYLQRVENFLSVPGFVAQ